MTLLPDPAALSRWPARPPSEVEWEELLVHLEVYPRILRNALEEAPDGAERARPLLERLAAREGWLSEALEALRQDGRVEPGAAPPAPGAPDAAALAWRIDSLRARSFARVQRRGLEVWEWSAAWGGGGERVAAYPLLRQVALDDGEALAAVRAALRGEG